MLNHMKSSVPLSLSSLSPVEQLPVDHRLSSADAISVTLCVSVFRCV